MSKANEAKRTAVAEPPPADVSTLVTWSTPSDIENPLQWSTSRKWINVLIISVQGTLTPLASTLPAIAAPTLAKDFHTSNAITPTLPVAVFVLGLGLGPLYLAPLSEMYGRRAIYVVSFAIFGILNVGCALAPNLAGLIVLRFLSGMAGSAGPSLGGASIGDMFVKAERGTAQALYGFGPTGGPVLGGVLGGFILDRTGSWRWLMWVTAIAPGVTVIACMLLLHETYAPVLLRARARKLRREHPGRRYHTRYDDVGVRRAILLNISRPLRMLFTSPICASLAVYVGMVYGILYLHLLSLSLLFSPQPVYGLFTYRWTGGTSGLSFLGIGVGVLAGTFLSAKFANRVFRWRNSKTAAKTAAEGMGLEDHAVRQGEGNQADSVPENRLFLLKIGMIVIPFGLIMYAWSAGRTHWIVPLLGAAIFATGMIVSYVAFQTYMVDVFTRFAASALATATILRSVLGCVFTMIGFELYKSLGYAWGTMLLAFLCIVMIPLPFILEKLGPRLRKKQFDF